MEGDRSNLRIEVKYPSRSGRTEPTVLIVQVPTLADLEIETVSADIDVHGVAPRELSLESVSGDIVANVAEHDLRPARTVEDDAGRSDQQVADAGRGRHWDKEGERQGERRG
jgi:DUF4097 and DUF4098 domain-containing protein YvlB